MKNAKLFVIPLVLLLSSCNTNIGNSDIFTKARNSHKVSTSTKQGVLDRYNLVTMNVNCESEAKSYSKENGEWKLDSDGSTSFMFVTECCHAEGFEGCSLTQIFDYGKETQYTRQYFAINKTNDKFEYVIGGDDYLLNKDASKVYKKVFNSFHSWNASYFSGATLFLVANYSLMPQVALNSFAKSFEIIDEKEGSFYINKKDDCLYKAGRVEYEIHEFMATYEDYVLKTYLNKFSLTAYSKEDGVEKKAVISYRFQTSEEIKYVISK